MSERTPKILLAVGVATGFFALTLAFLGGSHFQWTSDNESNKLDVRIGAEGSFPVFALTTISIAASVLGVAFLSLSIPSKTTGVGSGQVDSATPPETNLRPSFVDFVQNLSKSKNDVWIGGVCGGLGEHTPIPSWVWRALFAVMIFGYGVGLAAYIVLWIFVPEGTRERPVTGAIASPSSPSK
jgi:phage shock protein PspC (stress-responsive transcriptional regulator)